MPIPISLVIDVSSTVINSVAPALSMDGLFLTDNQYLESATVRSFSTPNSVGNFFGTASDEYKAAGAYFRGYDGSLKKPTNMLLYRKDAAVTAGWLRGGSLAKMTLAELQAIPVGTITVSIDGAPTTSSSIDLSGAASFSAAAVLIADALMKECTYSSIHNAFIITSSTTGASSSVGFASGVMATSLMLTSATGAIISVGGDVFSYTDTMNAIFNSTQNWTHFTAVTMQTLAEQLECAKWAEDTLLKVAFVPHTTESAVLNPSTTADILGQAAFYGYNGIFPIYGTYIHAAAQLGFLSCLDPTSPNGWRSVAYMTQSGLEPSVTSVDDAQTLIDKGYAFVGDWTTRTMRQVFGFIGKNPSKYAWVDSYLGKVFIESAETDALATFMTSNAVSNDNTGRLRLTSVINGSVMLPAQSSGIVSDGRKLTQTEKDEIDAIMGVNAWQDVENNGFHTKFFTASASDISTRTARGAVAYISKGYVHFVKLNNYISI
jgi:hypothetical protein